MRDGFCRIEIFDAIAANDLKALGELFDCVGLKGKDACTPYTKTTHTLVYTALGCAASTARGGKLPEATVAMLIDRTYSCVSVYDVSRYCLLSLGYSDADIDYGIIPEKIRHACMHDECDAGVAAAFAEMSEEQFKATLKLLCSGKVKSIDYDFSQLILNYVHMHETVDQSVLLSIMVSALKDIEGVDDEAVLGMLGALFGR